MSQLCGGCGIGFIKTPKGYNRVKVLNIISPETHKCVFLGAPTPKKDTFICHDCLIYLKERTTKEGRRTSRRRLITPTKFPTNSTRPTTSPHERQQESPPRTPIPPIPSLSAVSLEQKAVAAATKPSTSMTTTQPPGPTKRPSIITPTPPPQSKRRALSPRTPTSSLSIEEKGAPTTTPTPHSTHSAEEISSPETAGLPPKKRFQRKDFGQGPLGKAKYYMADGHYLSAFKCLLQSPVKHHMMTAYREAIDKERRKLFLDSNGPLRKPVDPTAISSFSWDGLLEWAARKAPVLTECLRSIFPPPPDGFGKHVNITVRGNKTLPKVGFVKRKKKATKQAQAQSNQLSKQASKINQRLISLKEMTKRRAGVVLCMALFTSSTEVNFIQKCIGIELWKQGCGQKVITTLNHMGLSMGFQASRKAIDNLRFGHREKIKAWKKKAEVKVKQTLKRKQFKKNTGPYSVTWDNVQLHGKHQQYALTFAHQHKVDFRGLPATSCRAIEVPTSSLLPTPEIFDRLRGRMVTLVMRILVENLGALSKIPVNQHIPHAYTEEMNHKSNIANLGVVSSDPSSNAGVIEIMRFLHEFVPLVDEQPLPILCCGEGLSVERMIGCKQMTNGGRTPSQRLDGLIPTPQEFHKEMLLLQDSMDLLYKPESECARGTIAHLKNFFTHRSLKKKVSENVQHVWDMVEFATSAYVTLLATTFCGMATVDDVPDALPKRKSEQLGWLKSLAYRIVHYAWMAPAQKEINIAAASAACAVDKSEKDFFLYCHCRKDTKETMVQCCSDLCEIGWVHLSCAGLTEAPGKDDDYYCSDKCMEDGSYMYCTCRKRKGGEMIQCQMAEDCKWREWYHKKCLVPADQIYADGKWYCCEECAAAGEKEDFVQNYTKALMWEGLNHLARRDAVCEGDGPAMVDSWKIDLLQFWGRSHPKYFLIGHYMLTGIGGYLPENLQLDLTWNRVANVSGKPGANIGLDLVNEFLNNDFKEMMKRAHGRYTDKVVQRCAEMAGAFGKDLDNLLSHSGVVSFENSWSRRESHKRRQVQDIKAFVKEFRSDALFSNVPGRFHHGLENFRFSNTVKKPTKMGKKMRRLAEDIDIWEPVLERAPIV